MPVSIVHATHLSRDFENIDEDVESESGRIKSSIPGVVDDKKVGKDAQNGKNKKDNTTTNGNDSRENGRSEK